MIYKFFSFCSNYDKVKWFVSKLFLFSSFFIVIISYAHGKYVNSQLYISPNFYEFYVTVFQVGTIFGGEIKNYRKLPHKVFASKAAKKHFKKYSILKKKNQITKLPKMVLHSKAMAYNKSNITLTIVQINSFCYLCRIWSLCALIHARKPNTYIHNYACEANRSFLFTFIEFQFIFQNNKKLNKIKISSRKFKRKKKETNCKSCEEILIFLQSLKRN